MDDLLQQLAQTRDFGSPGTPSSTSLRAESESLISDRKELLNNITSLERKISVAERRLRREKRRRESIEERDSFSESHKRLQRPPDGDEQEDDDVDAWLSMLRNRVAMHRDPLRNSSAVKQNWTEEEETALNKSIAQFQPWMHSLTGVVWDDVSVSSIPSSLTENPSSPSYCYKLRGTCYGTGLSVQVTACGSRVLSQRVALQSSASSELLAYSFGGEGKNEEAKGDGVTGGSSGIRALLQCLNRTNSDDAEGSVVSLSMPFCALREYCAALQDRRAVFAALRKEFANDVTLPHGLLRSAVLYYQPSGDGANAISGWKGKHVRLRVEWSIAVDVSDWSVRRDVRVTPFVSAQCKCRSTIVFASLLLNIKNTLFFVFLSFTST